MTSRPPAPPRARRVAPAVVEERRLEGERLQKALADRGFGSRREIESWVVAGRISVNGRLAVLGDRVKAEDVIRIDGRRVERSDEARRNRVLLYHKPEGEVTTRHEQDGRPTVFDHLPRLRSGRWVAIGRLDLNTSGLLLLTNDGVLAHRMMHPSGALEREYAVRVYGDVQPEMLSRLRTGVELDDGMAHFEKLSEAGGEGQNRWFHVVLREGRNREVKRLWETQGVRVSRLIRIRYGNITLPPRLRAGRWAELPAPEVRQLYQSVGLTAGDVKPARSPMSSRSPGSGRARDRKR